MPFEIITSTTTSTTFLNDTNTTDLDLDDEGQDDVGRNKTIILLIVFAPTVLYTLYFWIDSYCNHRKHIANKKKQPDIHFYYEEDLESNQYCFKNKKNNKNKNKKNSNQKIEIKPQHKAITVNYRFYNAIFKPIPECSICLQSIIVKRATLNCGHTFHKSCIDKVTRSNTCPKCPMCRANIV